MLCVTILREFDELSLAGNYTANHLNHTTEGLIEYLLPIHALSKQEQAMRRAMRKPCDMIFKSFAAQLTEIKNFIPFFPGSDATNNITPEELNKILLHAVPNVWAKKSNYKYGTSG